MSGVLPTYNETALHAALKRWAAGPEAHFEVNVDGYVVDVVQGDGELVEIQTGNFGAIGAKLSALARNHRLRLVYPIAVTKWIVRRNPDGDGYLSRRRSPRKGAVSDLFYELVRVPYLLADPNVTLEVVLTEEEEFRHYGQTRRRRRWRWITDERRLLQVIACHEFASPADLGTLLPASLPERFTTADLASALNQKRALAQKMAYCLRKLALFEEAGKQGNALVYRRLTS
ncbi:MAG: hypothetical protein RRC07_05010 [Anaerolineae bacterium]|nr:hypothetical protein [Anaerolineae bacterium]